MIIADDEKKIRESMRDSIDWGRLGVSVIGVCQNGMEAYDMILDESPDLVLTDIRMPGLSGLELIQRITQTGQNIEFIILSGYSEFSYTKEAMKYGIKHYLLKPCSEEELTQAVTEAIKDCYHRRISQLEKQYNSQMLKDFWESGFRNLLIEGLAQSADIPEIAKRYEQYISFSHVNYEMITVAPLLKTELSGVVNQLCEYHQNQAPGIPLFCLYTGMQLIAFFEGYAFDYEPLDQIIKELETGRGRKSFQNLYQLMEELQRVSRTGGETLMLYKGKWELTAWPVPAAKAAIMHTGKDFVDKTISYIHENLSDPELSLKMIAETQLFMNVDYLSHQFCKYAGCKFSTYLANTRIKEAKRMFAVDPGISIMEVAAAVGCGNNPQYFSVLFKKHTGFTASDYIKNSFAP